MKSETQNKLSRQLAAILITISMEAENLIRSSPYSWITSNKKSERFNNVFIVITLTRTFLIFDLDL